MQNPTPQVLVNEQPKKSNTGLIIGIVAAVLVCCCCLIVIIGGFYMSTSISKVYSSINEQLTAIPEMPSFQDATVEPSEPSTSPNATSEPLVPSIPGLSSDTVPQGGLGDELQRTQAWAQSLTVTLLAGCTPVAKDTTIEVTRQPDANGVWQEKWTIACDGGSSIPVDVTFTPSSNGITDITVEKAK